MIFYGRFKRRREMSGKEHQAEAIELSFKKSLEEKCRRWRSSIKNKSVCEFFRSNIIIAICFFYEIAHTLPLPRYHIHQLFPSFFMISENFFWWYVMQKFVIEGWTHREGGPSKAHTQKTEKIIDGFGEYCMWRRAAPNSHGPTTIHAIGTFENFESLPGWKGQKNCNSFANAVKSMRI